MTSPPERGKQRREAQLKRIQKQLSAYLTGGTKVKAGLTGKEKVQTIIDRSKHMKIAGRKKLEKAFGIRAIEKIERNAKVDFFKKYLSMAKGFKRLPPKSELSKIPESIRKSLDISVTKSEFIGKTKGFSKFKDSRGRIQIRDSKGRFAKA